MFAKHFQPILKCSWSLKLGLCPSKCYSSLVLAQIWPREQHGPRSECSRKDSLIVVHTVYHFFCMFQMRTISCEPPHDKTNEMACAPSEDSDQPGHLPSLIRDFAVRMKKHWVLNYPLSTLRWLISLKRPRGRAVSTPDFGSRGRRFESRWRGDSSQTLTGLHCTEPFMFTLPSSRNDWNTVEGMINPNSSIWSYWADGCPGWSESSLGAQSVCWFCRAVAHIRIVW